MFIYRNDYEPRALPNRSVPFCDVLPSSLHVRGDDRHGVRVPHPRDVRHRNPVFSRTHPRV